MGSGFGRIDGPAMAEEGCGESEVDGIINRRIGSPCSVEPSHGYSRWPGVQPSGEIYM
jgi:hypothetical protein